MTNPDKKAVPEGSPIDLEALTDPGHPTKAAAEQWGAQHLRPRGQGRIDAALWREAGRFGVLGLKVPQRLGGCDATATDVALTLEGLGASGGDLGEVFGLASQTVAANRTLATWGSEAVHDRWFPALARGEAFACFAMSEHGAGSSPWGMTTTAVPHPDGGWLLNGEKAWSTLSPIADVAVVFAATDPGKGRWGISAFCLDMAGDGVECDVVDKYGLSCCPFGDLRMHDVHLPDTAMLGRPGAGGAIFTKVIDFERAVLYAIQIGATESLIRRTIDRARSHRQGGAHIGSHQAVSHRVVEMALRHESARTLLYKSTLMEDLGRPATLSAAYTKLAASEMAIQASIDAIRIHGSEGYTRRSGLDLELLDALGGLAYSGTPDVARNVIASLLGVDRPAPRSG